MRTLSAALCLLLLVFSIPSNARDFNSSEERIFGAYLAYYGRPPDPGGLAYWSGRLTDDGGDINTIINSFGDSEEYKARFGDLTNTQLVTNLYDQLFGRAPDQGGLDFYVEKLNSGEWNLQKISLIILDGTTGSDVTIIENRLEFCKYYVSDAEEGSTANPSGEELAGFIDIIDDTSESLQAAYSQLDVSNNPLTADAGPDQEVSLGATVYLDGVNSFDADNDALSYSWSVISSPEENTQLTTTNQVTSSFTPAVAGAYTLKLEVSDDSDLVGAAEDLIVILVTAGFPTAVAGSDLNISRGDLVILNGDGSFDSYGNPVSFVWQFESKPEGSSALLDNSNTVAPSFIPDINGEYLVSLTIDNGGDPGAKDELVVTVKDDIDWLEVSLVITNSGMSGNACGVFGPITMGNYQWTFSDCGLYGDNGWPVSAVITNHNSQKTYTATRVSGYSCFSYPCDGVAILSGAGNIAPSSQSLTPGSWLKFNLSLWLAHQVVGGWAEFDIDGVGTVQGLFELKLDNY